MEKATDITTLFSRDPMDMTDGDIDSIIKVMREKRAIFKAAPAVAKKAPAKLTEKQKAVKSLNLDIKL